MRFGSRPFCAAGVVAVLVLAAACSSGGDTSPTSVATSDLVSVPPPTTTEPPDVTLGGNTFIDRLYATVIGRWVLVYSTDMPAGGPPENPLPWFELSAPRVVDGVAYDISLQGFDGCNSLGSDAMLDDEGVLESAQIVSTAVGCEPPGVAFLAQGTRLTWMGKERLEFTSPTGEAYAFEPLDGQGELVVTPSGILGEWRVDADPVVGLSLGDDWMTLGPCHGTWTIDSTGVLQIEWSDDPHWCLLTDAPTDPIVPSRPAAVLLDALASDRVVARRAGDDLTLATEGIAIALAFVGEPVDPRQLALATGAAFGLRPGDGVVVDREVTRISALLGAQPTLDTGWYPVPDETPADGTEDCIGGPDYRVVWWGDLRLAFWREPGGAFGPSLWNWSVGDRDVMWFGRSEPHPQPDAPASGLDSGMGFVVGDPVSVLDPTIFVLNGPTADGLDRYVVMGPSWAVVAARDGVIVGFGSQLVFC